MRSIGLLMGILLAGAGVADAKPGLTLPHGKVSLTGTLEMNASENVAVEPVSIAPDVGYGVNDALTLSIVHSGFARTGFRGSAGAGLCVSGEDKGCAKAYDNVGFEALYGLASGPFSLAANGGVHLVKLDPMWADVKVGVKGRYTIGQLSLLFSPSVLVGVNDRDAGNKGAFFVPAGVSYKLVPKLALGAGTGIKGPLDNAGDSWMIPFGINAAYSPDPKMNVGAALTFGQITGASAMPDATKGPEWRWVQVWFAYTI